MDVKEEGYYGRRIVGGKYCEKEEERFYTVVTCPVECLRARVLANAPAYLYLFYPCMNERRKCTTTPPRIYVHTRDGMNNRRIKSRLHVEEKPLLFPGRYNKKKKKKEKGTMLLARASWYNGTEEQRVFFQKHTGLQFFSFCYFRNYEFAFIRCSKENFSSNPNFL